MPLRLTSAPATEPVTLAEAKAHLRLDDTLDDVTVTSLIRAAREYVEQMCWRGLITQTYELVLEGFRGEDTLELGSRNPAPAIFSGDVGRGSRGFLSYIELPMGQLQSVTSVKYIDNNGVQQTLAPSEYSVDNVSVPGRLRPEFQKSWPPTRTQWDAVRVVYVVGFADPASVPQAIKQAILLLVAAMYEFRTPEVAERVLAKVGFSVDALLSPHRLARIG